MATALRNCSFLKLKEHWPKFVLGEAYWLSGMCYFLSTAGTHRGTMKMELKVCVLVGEYMVKMQP